MEEKHGLRWLIQHEGKYQSWDSVPENVREEARRFGYEEGLRLVLEVYNPAGKCRQAPNGVNLNASSLQMFCAFIQACEDAANRVENPVIQALLLHNAASASAKHNGNTDGQTSYNLRAHTLLQIVDSESQDDGWWAVHEKVAVGLYESGVIPFNEANYRKIIASMTGRSKDEAGRRDFLAKWLESQGRNQEVVDVLERAKVDTTSDSTQVARAFETLRRFTSLLAMIFLFFAPIIMPRIAIAFC